MEDMMKCVMIEKYGAASDVLNIQRVPVPNVGKGEVLVRQHATSVNPIDCRVRGGYGRVILSKMRGFELPLVLGRDVSGQVVKVGPESHGLSIGDAVFGISSTKAKGAYAEFVVVKVEEVARKPESLSFESAAAFPYVACTVWDALVTKAGLNPETAKGKKVFVQGGAGGIGSFAIQLLKAWGAYVATTCSSKQKMSVRSLGADVMIDYESEDYTQLIAGYDVALETVGGPLEEKTLSILRKDGEGVFVTLIHPLLMTFDEYGLVKGAIKNLSAFRQRKKYAKQAGVRRYHWSTFKPNGDALAAVSKLVEVGKMFPHIDREYNLDDIVSAHEYCEQGRSNGKIIIQI